jgi:hypothetical protein
LEWLASFSTRHADELRRLQSAEAEARRQRELLEWLAQISEEHERKLRRLLQEEAAAREFQRRAEQLSGTMLEANWDPAKHPRLGGPPNAGWWATASGGRGGQGSTGSAPRVQPRPTVNANGVEVAGTGPEITKSYRDKVQSALETLDPAVARWWKANSVNGQIRSRAAGWWQSKSRSWLEKGEQPVIEVDQNLTPGEAAQAIIDEVKAGWFADSIGTSYKKYKFARSNDLEEFRQWQQGATAEAAHLASVLAEFYVNSIATLTPAGDLVVTLGDVAENGPRWDQLLSILPYIGHLPVVAIVFKFGKREARIPKALARKFNLMTEGDQKLIKAAISKAETDEEAAAIMKREVTRIAGARQIHHPISDAVHRELEKHKNLSGIYRVRDPRFENLAKDLGSHQGYQSWHRQLDAETVAWLRKNDTATQSEFEAWLRRRYSQPDLKSKFPKSF